MKISPFIIIFLSGILAYAQPGYIDLKYNINDLPDEYAQQNKESPDIFRLTVIIDSTSSDFSKLDLLKYHSQLSFEINTSKFPKQFDQISFDSITEVKFYCNEIVSNISNLKGFKNAKELQFIDFIGENLPAGLSEFDKLERLDIQNAINLKKVKVLTRLRTLKSLSLNCNQLKTFPKFPESNTLSNIQLMDVSKNIDLKYLKTLKNMGGIELRITSELAEFPNYLPRKLEQIRIVGNIHSIANINLYPKLQFLELRNTELENLDINFKETNNIRNIHLRNNLKMKNIEGIHTCSNLEYLLLSYLPLLKEFHFKNLNLKSGLTIQFTGIEKIEPIEKLDSLKYLYLRDNDYLAIDEISGKTHRFIWNNGNLVNKK